MPDMFYFYEENPSEDMSKDIDTLLTLDETMMHDILNASQNYIYIVDTETFQIIFANRSARSRSLRPVSTGALCYQVLQGGDEPCELCPITQQNKHPQLDRQVLELFDRRERLWKTVHAFIYHRGNGRKCCLITVIPDTRHIVKEPQPTAVPPSGCRLELYAYTDEVTGIANNHKFESFGADSFEGLLASGRGVAIIALKFVGLHNINSIQGYAFGDAVLRAIVEVFSRLMPADAMFARRRGNDFVILYPLDTNEPHAEVNAFTSRLGQAAHDACLSAARGWLKLHLGVSLFPEHGKTFEMLNRRARQALTLCIGPDREFVCSFYNDTLMSQIREREELKLELAVALRRNEMELYFQPKIDVRCSRVAGVEALLRWNHPARGWISPSLFIPLAEESMIILSIDEWVIHETCRQWRRLQGMGCPQVPVSLNLSPQKFYQPGILDLLNSVIAQHRIPPTMLEIELTERTALQDITKAADIMRAFRARGMKVSIDDFGTGYSSLNYLRALPFDVVKLDRSFIVDPCPRSRAALQAIVSLIKIYDAQVVFEGIETLEQYEFALQAKCDLVQGFYTGEPMPSEKLAKLLLDTV